jgi:hypothetical protein
MKVLALIRKRVILAAIIFASSLLFSSSPTSYKVEIKKIETIGFENDSDMQFVPRSFCVIKDERKDKTITLLFILDHRAGVVKVFKKGKTLRFLKQFGPNRSANTKFRNPVTCFYNATHKKFGIIDGGSKRTLYLFNRKRGTAFNSADEIIDVNGYDVGLSGDGKHAVIAGYYKEKSSNTQLKNKTFELYSIDLKDETQKKNPLLQSFEKYDLKDAGKYHEEYFMNRTLPAIGIRSFIDVWGDHVYHVWEGKLRIIKINIVTAEQTIFDYKTQYYIEPDATKELLEARRQKDYLKTRKERDKMSFVRNIFATQTYVFVIYRGPKNGTNFQRMQIYTSEGVFIDDIPLPIDYYAKTWLDKSTLQLYSLSRIAATRKYCMSICRIDVKNKNLGKENKKKGGS